MALNRETPITKIQERIERKENRESGFFQPGEEIYDSEGYLHIKADLRGGDIFQPYSGGLLLNEDLISHIERLYGFAFNPSKVAVDFYLNEEELPLKDRIRGAYHLHYESSYHEAIFNNKKNHWTVFILFMAGVLFLIGFGIATFFLNDRGIWGLVVPEVLSIIAWVFIWAATEKFFFDSRDIKRHKRNCAHLKEARITFLVEKK